MPTVENKVFKTMTTTVAAGETEIVYPGNFYQNATFYVEPVSGGTASVEITGDTLTTIEAGAAVWHESDADLTDASANVHKTIFGASNAFRLSATTENASFKILLRTNNVNA